MTDRTRRFAAASAVFCAVTASAFAQAPTAPTPGPEHQKLGYFVGKWTAEGTMAPSPFGPGGKTISHDDCQWFDGKFAVVCRSEGQSPAGPSKGLGILSYSAEEKAYTYYGLDNTAMTMSTVPRGTVAGATWTYTDDSKMGGKLVKSRYVFKELSATSYTFKWELLGEDGKWMTIMDGTTKKSM